eukprot:103449-Chlamydomonas_euryale.AAC.1
MEGVAVHRPMPREHRRSGMGGALERMLSGNVVDVRGWVGQERAGWTAEGGALPLAWSTHNQCVFLHFPEACAER